MSRLVLGPEFITSEFINFVVDDSGNRTVIGADVPEHLRDSVTDVLVGYNRMESLDVLRCLPNTRSVEIRTPWIRDLSALRELENLENLAINRPRCRMDFLGELTNLRDLYLDDWRPGASSIFKLEKLQRLGIQKFQLRDLREMSGFTQLRELWLNAGRLASLDGIPPSLHRLRITCNRFLTSLGPLTACQELSDLRMESVRGVRSLEGLQAAPLTLLSLSRVGALDTLEPLRGKATLDYVVLVCGTLEIGSQIDALYSLPNLRKLIISRKADLDEARLRASSANVDLRLSRP